MKNFLHVTALVLGFVAAGGALARSDVRDGNAMVTPSKGDKYSIDGSTMGKAELYGYMGDLRDREHLTGIVLKRGATDDQRHVIGSIARTLQLKAFEQDGSDLKPIDLPAVAPSPPPIENKAETPAPPPADAASGH